MSRPRSHAASTRAAPCLARQAQDAQTGAIALLDAAGFQDEGGELGGARADPAAVRPIRSSSTRYGGGARSACAPAPSCRPRPTPRRWAATLALVEQLDRARGQPGLDLIADETVGTE